MLLLTHLEPEVLTLILEFVNDVSPRTTKAIACVSWYLNGLTKLISHRHKTIELKGSFDDDSIDLIESWIRDDLVLANIRTLTVKGWYNVRSLVELDLADEDEDEDDIDDDDDEVDELSASFEIDETPWGPLSALLEKIGRLKSFVWSIKCPLPRLVLNSFERSQLFSTLRIYNFVRASPLKQEPDYVELQLSKSPALTHIRYAEDVNYVNQPDVRSFAFRSIVASAPNLEYAGYLDRNHRPRDDDILAELKRYEPVFYKHNKPSNSVRQLTLDGVDINMGILTEWSSIVDLTTVENVKFSRGFPALDYFQNAAAMLPNLKHLSLNLRSVKDVTALDSDNILLIAVQDYIKACSPLQTLSLWSWLGVVPLSDILHRHGATLQSLQLHEREVGGPRSVLSVDDIKAIRDSCASLRTLTFDLNRSDAKLRWDNDQNKQYYEVLAKFSHLAHLQIYFDLGVSYIRKSNTFSHSDANIWPFDEHTDNEEDSTINATDDATTSSNTASTNNIPDPDSTASSWGLADVETSSPPAAKRQRIMPVTDMRPSRDVYLERYVKQIWTTVFGGGRADARHLDIKIGEWEGSVDMLHGLRRNVEWKLKRHFMVRPHERDDVDEPVVKTNLLSGVRYY